MMGMTQTRRTMVASVAGLAVAGVLAGCVATGPDPIDRTRYAGEAPGTPADELVAESGSSEEKGVESSALADAVSNDGEEDARTVAEEGELLGEGLDVMTDVGAFASDCPDEEEEPDGEEPCSCLLSFRGDVMSATFPWPNDGTTDSMLPAVVAVSDGRALAIEMAVTYETSLLHQTNEFHNEATRLGDEIRREVVRLVRLGVTKRGRLEDALIEALGYDMSQVTGVDIYNVYEVEPVVSPDGYVAYVPVMGTAE